MGRRLVGEAHRQVAGLDIPGRLGVGQPALDRCRELAAPGVHEEPLEHGEQLLHLVAQSPGRLGPERIVDVATLASVGEFLLEGLYVNNRLSKFNSKGKTFFKK